MTDFTKGEWKIQRVNSPYIIWRVNDSSRYNSVATGIYKEADARLIAAAPDMYGMLYEVMLELKGYETKVSYKKTYYELIQELLARIDGKEENHE